jgi:pilus assembly protein Flp/PilA
MKLNKQTRRSKRGAALVEYGLIVAGVALVAAAAVSIFGTKTAGMIGASAAILPGANANDNGLIETGRVVKTDNVNGSIGVTGAADSTLGENLGVTDDALVTDPNN